MIEQPYSDAPPLRAFGGSLAVVSTLNSFLGDIPTGTSKNEMAILCVFQHINANFSPRPDLSGQNFFHDALHSLFRNYPADALARILRTDFRTPRSICHPSLQFCHSPRGEPTPAPYPSEGRSIPPPPHISWLQFTGVSRSFPARCAATLSRCSLAIAARVSCVADP